jgi:hypothetical protein
MADAGYNHKVAVSELGTGAPEGLSKPITFSFDARMNP